MEKQAYTKLAKSRYVNDKQITDHYAIIPTGQGLNALQSLNDLGKKVYEVIARRFVSIFYPAAEYQKVSITTKLSNEAFFASVKVLSKEGYLKVASHNYGRKKAAKEEENSENEPINSNQKEMELCNLLASLKKGSELPFSKLRIKEGETSPPSRYNSGSLILAMENAGKLIEDEELRSQIKGSGIGTSATRAEIIKKLTNNGYVALNGKTQIITPTLLGEMIYDVVNQSMKSMLNPELTASWEKGLGLVAQGEVTPEEYMVKLENFIGSKTQVVKQLNNRYSMIAYFDQAAPYYK